MSTATRTLVLQIAGGLTLFLLTAGSGWLAGSSLDMIRSEERINHLSQRLDEIAGEQKQHADAIRQLFETRGEFRQLTEEVRGLREDIRGLRLR